MKNILWILTAYILLWNNLYATPLDIKCPSAQAIINQGLDKIEKANLGETWIAYKNSSFYDTEENWHFFIWPIKAKNETQAYNKAIKLLSKITFTNSHYGNDGESKWCEYTSGSSLTGFTATTATIHGFY